uniref:hypothetical protein n=1 Tax=Dictyotopsis propagulifera TaxID=670095 RepID=UPI002E765AF6|nr:hypothetical protein V2485_pgp060 [Dictyotopsis propagulifera]WAM63197.1 hypothetical protein [Dictyotopsis propagulifera]
MTLGIKNILNLISIFSNFLLILIIIIRSPNEQSLQENLSSFQLFESSSKAERTLDLLIFGFTTLYFLFNIIFTINRSLQM